MQVIKKNLNIDLYQNKILNSYFENLSVAVIDIETTGLNPVYSKLILGGLLDLSYEPGSYYQFFADNEYEENLLLKKYIELIQTFDVLISYNGTSFDLPFLRNRLKKNSIKYDLKTHWSFDLYKMIHKHSDLRKVLPNLKQKTIEEFLGLKTHRKDEITGKESVDLYKQYLKIPNEKIAEIILLHNKDDLLQLSSILKILDKLNLHKIMFKEGFSVKHNNRKLHNHEINIKNKQLSISGTGTNIPSDFYSFKSSHHLTYKDNELFLTIPFDKYQNAEVIDLLTFSENFTALHKLPAFEKDYLIIRADGKTDYHAVNKLIRIVESEFLKGIGGNL